MSNKLGLDGEWLSGLPKESNWYWVGNEYGVARVVLRYDAFTHQWYADRTIGCSEVWKSHYRFWSIPVKMPKDGTD